MPTRVLTAALQMTTDRQQMTEVSAASACVSTVDVLRCMTAVSRCMHAQRTRLCMQRKTVRKRVAHIMKSVAAS